MDTPDNKRSWKPKLSLNHLENYMAKRSINCTMHNYCNTCCILYIQASEKSPGHSTPAHNSSILDKFSNKNFCLESFSSPRRCSKADTGPAAYNKSGLPSSVQTRSSADSPGLHTPPLCIASNICSS